MVRKHFIQQLCLCPPLITKAEVAVDEAAEDEDEDEDGGGGMCWCGVLYHRGYLYITSSK